MRLSITMASGLVLTTSAFGTTPIASQVISLDGDGWQLAVDPTNIGVAEKWWQQPRPEARPARIPWFIGDTFPGYCGVFWYWRDVQIPANPCPDGRYLLRFWDVDYLADVWVNGTRVGSHQGAMMPFTFDVTAAVKPGSGNRLAVRVLLPGDTPIEGFTFRQTPHGGAAFTQTGGIMDSVELLLTPAVRVEDLFVRTDPKTGKIRAQANLRNTATNARKCNLEFTVSPATSGETLDAITISRETPSGDTLIDGQLQVRNPRLWDLNDPILYRVTVRVTTPDSPVFNESSTRCGFRDFRFDNGFFRLNGRRIFLRSSHTAAETPVGHCLPRDPGPLRSELVSCKAMGFNMVRFIGRVALRNQLHMADEIGLLVYEENPSSWMLHDSPNMAERFDRQVAAMARRDRNHPSIVIWGLLNETGEGPVFRQAVKALPLLRALDETRLVMLGSGRFDAVSAYLNGLELWKPAQETQPNVLFNAKPYAIYHVPLWPAKSVSLNPGTKGEYSVARWTAPAAGDHALSARFRGTGSFSTTDVHVLHAGKPIYAGFINVRGWGDCCDYSATLNLAAGDTIDFVVGWGGGYAPDAAGLAPWTDTTEVHATIQSSGGARFDLAADFSNAHNPNGPWCYGSLAPGQTPDTTTFAAFPKCEILNTPNIGGISNPGSDEWENVLGDLHTYPRSPHRRLEIERLRTVAYIDRPLLLAEYGMGSGTHFPRMLRHYEALGEESYPGAKNYQEMLARFMADWDRWKLAEAFPSPEDFFDKCLAKMAGLRRIGINALRSNPAIVGYNLTGTHDTAEAYSEGVITAFREHKPGTFDAMCDVFAPLRWCLFTEPVSVYRGRKVKLEAVLSNEDVLKPGDYPALLQVLGPTEQRLIEREITVRIPAMTGNVEPPYAIPVFSEELPVDAPSGKCRFVARLLKGGPATGESVEFYVTDPHDMPTVKTTITLWGKDPELTQWLRDHGIETRPFAPGKPAGREVILVPAVPGGSGDAQAWHELVERIAAGSAAVFLTLDVFEKKENPLGWLPLANKGSIGLVSEYRFPQVYIRDEWAKHHPIFDGLPTGLMDYVFYREIIPDLRYAGQDTPDEAVAGAFRTGMGYNCAELMLTVYKLGQGRFILNALRVRQALGQDPTAERLLRNMLRYAARDADKPIAPVPPDFDSYLKSLGY
ncbi:MAG TPA: glycoside hydrolase family 2 TIM barrel-domain containing protein [Phycisphaerae bacterium]|nr:glycoside hydrolase family 2 TIM barrel-domain containing protein [Phycisphaerae bacterium]HRY66622.1 glycoside hydrolase family 2 TIM barrel-domain containing protein [Phycisphaerae bacterium]